MLRITEPKRRLGLIATSTLLACFSIVGVAYAFTEHFINGETLPPSTARISGSHYITNDYVHNTGGGTRLLGCGSPEYGPYTYTNNTCLVYYGGLTFARGYAENASPYHVNMNAQVSY